MPDANLQLKEAGISKSAAGEKADHAIAGGERSSSQRPNKFEKEREVFWRFNILP